MVTRTATVESAAPMGTVEPTRWPTPLEFLRLRCPICWQGAMFRSPIHMNASCPSCGHTYDRGHGYFLGAMMFSYAIVVALEAGILLGFRATGMSWPWALGSAVATVPIIGPLLAFPYSRLWWVMVERRYLHGGEEDDAGLKAELARRGAVQAARQAAAATGTPAPAPTTETLRQGDPR